ncbi:bifunctional serine/threonine-protein kinase/formylglycine-generating enzyme family protein [Sorangium atrum]|uniref:Bifunctional serine/threonine-protein kinase/formylglycine-generating enzyme family protein n=1 Tax=Sorangium atrum TaxID=2995308 RepID=A0ABT5BXL6_9BACT|nr:bifunctional serine/threonine-protein kinase/formylglycine-generating enzyme family protein [Sorangium aterium]MDC0677691.1 bifunctional serine/threonine-protein kinase/formylglycine-generating enzyme family protein [Sorangium aterium]
MAPSDPFGWVGATIGGKYRLDAVVGEGGFGVVYRGQHLGFDEPVAVKCLKLLGSLAPAERASFQRMLLDEGRLLHRLSRASAGIVQALDTGAAVSPSGEWTPYLVLEWLHGVPLDREIAERRARGDAARPLAEAVALLAPAAYALEVAHAQGVAHRDVKPANLFLAEIGGRRTLKVLDFGIAKVLGELSSMTQAMAETGSALRAFTVHYGAPEQFHHRFGATGPWTDVFALALVLIEVASGNRALLGSDVTQLYIAATDPAFRPSLQGAGVSAPDAVEAVVRRALAIDPRERYRTAGELWGALEAAMATAAPAGAVALAAGSPPAGAAPGAAALGVAGTERVAAGPPAGGLPTSVGAPPTPSLTTMRGLATSAPPLAAPQPASPPPAPQAARAAPRRRLLPALASAAALAAAAGAGAVAFVRYRAPDDARPARVLGGLTAPQMKAPPPPDMVRVPAGRFTMGSEKGGKSERPPHDVTLTRAFDVDRTEVTVAAYQRCVEAGRCAPSGLHGPRATDADVEQRGALCTAADPAKSQHPISCVDQAQAAAYCAFVGKRLPTEAEWEYAARGADGREYPWGNEAPGCAHAIVSRPPGQGCGGRGKGTQEVGSAKAGASPSGALDMAGNVWEWVADGWDPGVYARGAQTDPQVPATGSRGVLRGGSWDFSASTAKATFRLAYDREAGDVSTGFRCVRSVD